MAADPIHQFQIEKLVDFGTVNLPVFGRTELAFTNSHLSMTIAFVLVVGFLSLVTANMKVVPGRLQTVLCDQEARLAEIRQIHMLQSYRLRARRVGAHRNSSLTITASAPGNLGRGRTPRAFSAH